MARRSWRYASATRQPPAVADKYGVPRVFEWWQDMLAEAHPEIVVIASPPPLHHAIALAAFAGAPTCFCEKPLAMTAAEGATWWTRPPAPGASA